MVFILAGPLPFFYFFINILAFYIFLYILFRFLQTKYDVCWIIYTNKIT